jgi:hypothetical protein
MDFDLTPEQEQLKQAVVEFARRELGGDLVADDRASRPSRERWDAAARFGLHGLPIPEGFGGSGRDLLTTALAMEGLGYGCRDNGLVFSINAHIWSAEIPLLHFGSEEQKGAFLPRLVSGEWIGVHAMTEESSGSDAFNIKTTARRRGYVLKGAKTFVTNGPVADLVIVFATVDPDLGPEGITAFLVEKGTPGFDAARGLEKMGLRTSPMGEVYLDECEVPLERRLGPEGAGVAIFNRAMDHERACILAANVGTLQHQLEVCVERARTWERFGKPIGKFQSVSNRIADMTVRLEASRLLLYKAAWLHSRGGRAALESAIAKLHVSESFVQSSLDAIQVFGGYGYATETGIERDLRDAVGGTIYSGTSDIQRLIIARYKGL